MAAPRYLSPQYITYDMISTILTGNGDGGSTGIITVDLINDPPLNGGMFLGQVEDYMAIAESQIFQRYLANYVENPLTTVLGDTWDKLLDNPAWYMTYASLKTLFINESLSIIYQNYFSNAGEGNNGEYLIKNAQAQINKSANMLLRLDQAGNPILKNCFVGLKLCPNFSQRIAQGMRVPCMPNGADQGHMAINSVPNFRWGFNR